MLKIADLAARGDFDAGPLRVSPSRRLIEGPAGSASLEPIVMKVFLLLLDAGGEVVTRDELFDSAWGGVIVGDDSLNRAIARVRKIAGETAPGLFEIETIPRTGYRITGAILEQSDAGAGAHVEVDQRKPNKLSRRTMIGGGAAAAVALAGGGWWLKRTTDDRRFEKLMERGEAIMDYGDGSQAAAGFFREAVAVRPDDPTAQGLLAYALVLNADAVNKTDGTIAFEEAEKAAQAALSIDRDEPNARLALTQLQRATLDLAGTEDRLRAVLATHPDSTLAMRLLWNLLQCAGRSREALALVERSTALRPMAAANNYPLAQLFWITGRTAEADRVIDRAMQSWPNHRFVRFARFVIFAFTGRPQAALAMLDNPATRPQVYNDEAVALWRLGLAAIETPSPSSITRVQAGYADAVKRNPQLANSAVLTLSALGQVDAAFDIANDLLLFRPPGTAIAGKAADQPRASSTAWRFTPWLFIPPTAPMRADPRFQQLCDGTGLTDYWHKRGVEPDYRRFKN